MAKKLYEETDIQNIAKQIRAMNGKSTTYKTSGMSAAMQANVAEKETQTALIAQIATALQNKTSGGGGITPTGTIDITANGEYDVTHYAKANVALPFESGEWVVPSTLTTGTTHVICTLKKYPRAFILLGDNIPASNSIVFSTMVPINSYGDSITSSTSMRKICAYNNSTATLTYTNTTANISTSAVGRLHVTSTFDVRIGANTTYNILAGTYKWFAIY